MEGSTPSPLRSVVAMMHANYVKNIQLALSEARNKITKYTKNYFTNLYNIVLTNSILK